MKIDFTNPNYYFISTNSEGMVPNVRFFVQKDNARREHDRDVQEGFIPLTSVEELDLTPEDL